MALSRQEHNDLDAALADSGCHGFQGDHPDLYAAAEAIVARHVAAALNAAADEIDAEMALQELCESKAADEGDPDEAAMYEQGATVAARCARIVRTAANSPP